MPPGDHIQRRQRRWGSKRPGEEAESAPFVAAAAFPASASDRFRPPSLLAADEPRRKFGLFRSSNEPRERERSRAQEPGPQTQVQGETQTRKGSWLRPANALDWALLVIEVAGALVVAWLTWQYIYTVYIDTGPKRVAITRPAATPTRIPGALTLTPTATPTRFAEVLPPETGDPGSVGGPPSGGPPPTSTTTPTATPTIDPDALLPTRLRIPAMFLDSVVHEVKLNMGEWEVAPMDIGHHEGTGVPGQTGNVVLAGHRDVNSALFRELDRLQPGDEIFVSNSMGEYRYIVTESMVVSPNQIEVMDPTDDKRVTLITCTPIGLATQRLVVSAVLGEDEGRTTKDESRR